MGIEDTARWLKEFNGRFAMDVAGLYKIEPFWRACNLCVNGYCCGQAALAVSHRPNNPFLLEEWWLLLEYVRDNFTEPDKKRLAAKIVSKSSGCIFLFGHRCNVHPARCWICRSHPYTISFYPAPEIFPVGEIELPSCPNFANSFGVSVGDSRIQKPQIIERDVVNSLVKAKLHKHKALWLIDASSYVEEFVEHIQPGPRPSSDWDEMLTLVKAGGMAEIFDLLVKNL